MDAHEIITRLRKSRNTLHTHFGIQAIGLYGSYAKNHASPDSDIDLLFLPRPGVRIGLEKRIELEDYLAQLLGSDKIELVNYRYLNPVVRRDIEESIIYT